MITFKPASREHTPLIIGIAGPSGSGKSYSALRLATGMCGGKPILLINTEGARGHIYADEYPVPTYDLEEPFSLVRYREAVEEAVRLKPGVIIIDSVSHAHEGPGGMLDQHEEEVTRRAGDDYKKRERVNFTAWIKPKADEAMFINAMLRADCHIVLCMRAKEKLKLIKGADPVPLGWQPICSDRMSFETTVTFVLPPGANGKPDYNELGAKMRKPLFAFTQNVEQLDEDVGRRLAQWAQGRSFVDMGPKIKEQESIDALRTLYESLLPEQQATWNKEFSARRRELLKAGVMP